MIEGQLLGDNGTNIMIGTVVRQHQFGDVLMATVGHYFNGGGLKITIERSSHDYMLDDDYWGVIRLSHNDAQLGLHDF